MIRGGKQIRYITFRLSWEQAPAGLHWESLEAGFEGNKKPAHVYCSGTNDSAAQSSKDAGGEGLCTRSQAWQGRRILGPTNNHPNKQASMLRRGGAGQQEEAPPQAGLRAQLLRRQQPHRRTSDGKERGLRPLDQS